jgi:hypothetical protein
MVENNMIYCIKYEFYIESRGLNVLILKLEREKVWSLEKKNFPLLSRLHLTYSEKLDASSRAQVFPTVVIATPAMVIKTATTLAKFIVSCPRTAPNKRVKSPEVEVKTVVLATLVFASAEFDKYCIAKGTKLVGQAS